MKLIFFIYYFLRIICLNIKLWENSPKSFASHKGAIYTGETFIYQVNTIIISYNNSKSSYFQNLSTKEKEEINEILCPFSYYINNLIVLFTENNKIYTLENSKFKSFNIDITNIKSIKGIIVNNYNELLVSFIGSNTIILLINESNELKKKSIFSFDGMEIVNMCEEPLTKLGHFFILYKKNNNYELYLYSIYDIKLNQISNFNLDVELYDITEMYHSTLSNYFPARLILFSYNKNENLFIFYLFELIDSNYILKKFGNKYTFLPFRNAKIIKAFFAPFSEYLYYLIEIDNEKYAGVLDIINNIIIYNFKTTSEFISFQKFYIIYSEENSLYRTCPFNIKNIEDCNIISGNSRKLIKIENNINSFVNGCPDDNYILGGIYCYKNCPSGYYELQNYCFKCPIYDIDNQICSRRCKNNQIYDELNGICYSCKSFNQYKNFELNKCIDDCSPFNLINDDINFTCNSCKDLGQFLQGGKCVNDCGPEHFKDEENKVCIKCNKEEFFQNGECVKECDKLYKVDIKAKRCILCTPKEPFFQDGKCVKECNKFYKIDKTNNTCVNCQITNKPYLQNNECVQQCDEFYKIDDVNKVCINCKDNVNYNFLQNNECVEKCDEYYKIDNDNKVCINCQNDTIGTPYYQDGNCVKTCNDNYKIDENKKICINCEKSSPKNPFLQDNNCVDKCNNYYVQDNEKKKCYNCSIEKGKDFYFFNGKCVDECPKYYIKDEINKRCYNCEENSKNIYYENGICVENCSKFYYKDEIQKICIKCNDIDKTLYFQDNECVKECNQNYVIDNTSMICLNCSTEYPNEYPYYMNNKCVKQCNSEYVIDKINKICFKCKDRFKSLVYNENGVCKQQCSEYLVSDNNNYLCLNCSVINNTFYQDNKCVEKCSIGYINITEPNKACVNCFKTLGKYEYNGECVKKCPYLTIANQDIKTCQLCRELDLVNQYYDKKNNVCVSECPIGTEKDTTEYTCNICINFYNYITKKCVDFCPSGTELINKICQKCKYFDKKNNECVSQCSTKKYPFYIEEENYSICYEGFCGYGQLNKYSYKNEQKSIINNLYSCNCIDQFNFGKLCQYKYIPGDQPNKDIIEIRPLQDIVYTNKKNIFTFEFKENKNNNFLRYLEVNHTQYLKRRFKIFSEWTLNKVVASTDYYFIIEPGDLLDDYENIIKLKIYDENKNVIAINKLSIITKSIKSKNFYLTILKNNTFQNSLNNKNIYQIKLNELNKITDNYFYKYYYVTEDEEEFSLSNYIKNNMTNNNFSLPYCNIIQAKIKSDYNETIELSSGPLQIPVVGENTTLSYILRSYNTNNNEKYDNKFIWQILTEVKSYFSANLTKVNISEDKEHLEIIINIIKAYFSSSIANESNIINNVNYLEGNEDIIEPNVFISLLNQITIFLYQNNNNNNNFINKIYNIILDIIYNSLIHNSIFIDSLDEKTILSYLRTIDNLLFVNKNDNNKAYNIINILKNIVSKNMIPGTQLTINGNNFDIYLIKPGYYSEFFAIEKDGLKEDRTNDFTKYSDYKIKIEQMKESQNVCGPYSLFCLSKNNYDYLYDELTYLKNVKVTDLIISIMRINSNYFNNIFQQKMNKATNYNNSDVINDFLQQILDSFIIEIEEPITKKLLTNLQKFKYNLYIDLPRNYKNNDSKIICLPLNSIGIKNNDINIDLSKGKNCFIFQGSEKQKIACECNAIGEILIISRKGSSIIPNHIDIHKYKIVNSLSGTIILSTLALITIFSVSFIKYDFYEDKDYSYISLMNINIRAQYEYEHFKNLKNTNIYSFALYLLYYKYSFFNIFSIYKYNHPRYIRFFIEIIKILLNILISILLFYYNTISIFILNEIKDKESFSLLYASKSFLYSIIASIILFFISQIIYKIFEFKKVRQLIWKPKKDILKEYVFYYLKKEALFNKKLKSVKRRLLAYVNICGKTILEKKKNDKFSTYLQYNLSQKNKSINDCNNNNALIINNISPNSSTYSNNNLSSLKEKLIKETDKSNIFNSKEINTESHIYDKRNKKFIISKGAKSLTLSQKANDNISIWDIYKFELIKNKYIFKRSQNWQYNRENEAKTIKYCDLYIETQKNYTYIFSNDISFNQVDSTKNAPKLITLRLINIILFIILFIIDISILIVLNRIHEEYENYIIIINWLIPVLVQVLIFNFFINYIFALISSNLLFSYYKERKMNFFKRFIFNIFVEKYMKYLFKIRTLTKKYYQDFDNLK